MIEERPMTMDDDWRSLNDEDLNHMRRYVSMKWVMELRKGRQNNKKEIYWHSWLKQIWNEQDGRKRQCSLKLRSG